MTDEVVLIVDDEPNVVLLCQRLLERSGYRVIATTHPYQALDTLRDSQVDLLLVDINMPEVNGFQLVQLARQQQPDLAVIVITGFGGVETALTALKEGVDNLILKPFHNNDLIQTVQRTILESRHKRDALRLRALEPVFETSEVFFSERDLDRLPSLIMAAFEKYLNCPLVAIYHCDSDAGLLEPWAGQDNAKRVLAHLLVDPAVHAFIENREVIWASAGHGRYPLLQPFLTENQLSSVLLVCPFAKAQDLIFGVGRTADQPAFKRLDMEIFVILARQASAAIENALLYHNLQASLEQVEKSQQLMVQAERIAAAGRLTASIAHEINNPLQSLSNCLHLAMRKELSPQDHTKYLVMAQSELERLMHTVRQMLDLYRPGGKDRQIVDVNMLVRRTIDLVSPQFAQHRIELCTVLSEEPLNIRAVASQIQQVLINLLINAMEAMPGGGKVTVTTAAASEARNLAGGSGGPIEAGYAEGMEILVQDNGPGISPEFRGRIYEPFVSTKENGTGLGLAVSYGIISAHGGNIKLLDHNGPGACFRIYLPKEDNQ